MLLAVLRNRGKGLGYARLSFGLEIRNQCARFYRGEVGKGIAKLYCAIHLAIVIKPRTLIELTQGKQSSFVNL